MDINLASVSDETFEARDFESVVEDSSPVEPKRKINLKPFVQWVLYGVTFLVPLFFLPWTSEFLEFNKQSLLILAAGVGLVLFLAEVIQNGAVTLKTSKLYLPLGVLVVASLVTSVFSKNFYQSILGIPGSIQPFSMAGLLAMAILFFLTLNVFDDGGKNLKKVIVMSMGVALLFSVLQVFGFYLFNKAPYNSYSFNTVGTLNSLVLLGALLLPLFFEVKIRVWKFVDLSRVVAVLALFLMIVINWWVIWVAGFISLIAWMGFKILETKKTNVRDYVFPMAVVVIGVLLILINFTMPVLKDRLPVSVGPSFQTSLDISKSALREKPLIGYGLGEYGIAYDQFKPKIISQTIFARTHFQQAFSSAMTLATEGGLVMVLAGLFLLAMVGLELSKTKKRDGFMALAMAVFLFLFAYNITLVFFFFLSLALLELNSSSSHKKDLVFEDSPKYSLISSLAFIVGLVLVLAGGYFVILRYVSDSYYVKAVQGKDADTVITDFTKGINLIPQDTRSYRLLSQAIMIKLSNDLSNKADKTPAAERTQRLQNLAASSVDIAKRATDTDPNNVENWLNRGLIYQNLVGLVGGADQASVNMYQEALKRSPTDPAIFNNIGSIYLTIAENARVYASNPPKTISATDLDAVKKQALDGFAKAEENYKKAIDLNNNYGQALFALGVVYEREGKLPESIKQFEKLRTGNPNDPSIAFELGLLYYRNNQKDQAFTQLQQATTLFPNYSNARWYLSLLYEEKGDIDGALTQVQEILKTNPDNDLVKQRIAQLEAGKRIIPPGKVLDQKPL